MERCGSEVELSTSTLSSANMRRPELSLTNVDTDDSVACIAIAISHPPGAVSPAVNDFAQLQSAERKSASGI